MMQFTPQQMAGGSSYCSKVRIGNWNEDVIVEQVQAKNIVYKKSEGRRLLDQLHARTQDGSKPCILTPCSDGFLRYGYSVSLLHNGTQRILASNLDEELDSIIPGLVEYQASGVTQKSLRTSFVLLPAHKSQMKDFIEYGDEIMLATHPSLRINPHSGLAQHPCYLTSPPTGVMGNSSANSRMSCQGVSVARSTNNTASGYMRFRIEKGQILNEICAPDTDRRVNACDDILFINCASGKALTLDESQKCYSDYGQELAALCFLEHSSRRLHIMTREHKSERDPQQRRPVAQSSTWRVQVGSSEEEEAKCGQDETIDLLSQESVKCFIRTRMMDLELSPSDVENQLEIRTKYVDAVKLKYALEDIGIILSGDEFECISRSCTSNFGVVFDAFLQVIFS